MVMVGHRMLYATLPCSPPWCFCLLLSNDPVVRAEAFAFLRRVWELVLDLEASQNPIHVEYRNALHFASWHVFREPLELLDAGKWDNASWMSRRAIDFISAMWSGMMNTMGLENCFNDLRDNETRGARHKQRNPQTLQALSVSSMQSRYGGVVPLIDLDEAKIGRCDRYHCKPEIFRTEDAPTSKAYLGVDAKDIVENRKAWASTGPDDFSRVQLSLLHALLACEKAAWPKLWLSCLLREHMVVVNRAPGKHYYVADANPYTVSMLELKKDPERNLALFEFDEDDINWFVPVTALDQFWCFDYDLFLETDASGYIVGGSLVQVYLMADYCLRNFVHLLHVAELKKLCHESGIAPLPRPATQLLLTTALLDHYDIPVGPREEMLARVEKMVARRGRKRKAKSSDGLKAEEESDEGEAEEEQEDEGGEEVAALVPSVLKNLAPEEVAWVVGGCTAGGAALMEEETDVGLDAIAEALAPPGPPARPTRPDARTTVSTTGSSTFDPPLAPTGSATTSTSSTEPPAPALDPDVIRRMVDVRLPAAEALPCPYGCSLRKYEPVGKKFYRKAKLPEGCRFADTGARFARNTHHVDYGIGIRSEEKARLEAWDWLKRAEAAGAHVP